MPRLDGAQDEGPIDDYEGDIFHGWSDILHHIPAGFQDTHSARLWLVFSLLAHFKLTLFDFLAFAFKSDREQVQGKARAFTTRTRSGRFGPGVIWKLWWSRFKTCRQYLDLLIVQPRALEIGRQEFQRIQHVSDLKVDISQLSSESIARLLDPVRLVGLYKRHLPFTTMYLTHLVTTNNEYRRKKERKAEKRRQGTSFAEVDQEVGGAGDSSSDEEERFEYDPEEQERDAWEDEDDIAGSGGYSGCSRIELVSVPGIPFNTVVITIRSAFRSS